MKLVQKCCYKIGKSCHCTLMWLSFVTSEDTEQIFNIFVYYLHKRGVSIKFLFIQCIINFWEVSDGSIQYIVQSMFYSCFESSLSSTPCSSSSPFIKHNPSQFLPQPTSLSFSPCHPSSYSYPSYRTSYAQPCSPSFPHLVPFFSTPLSVYPLQVPSTFLLFSVIIYLWQLERARHIAIGRSTVCGGCVCTDIDRANVIKRQYNSSKWQRDN